jgi:predicted transcriptional regulator
MQDQTAKQDAIEAINRLPDNVAFDEIIYRLHVLNKAHQGMQDIDAGRVVSSDDLAKEIEQW